MSRPSARARLAAAWRVAADAAPLRAASARPVAIGWATVELDRAASELAAAFGLGSADETFRAAPRSTALGCACRVATGVLPDGGSLVLLESDTEGRLAASLARLGEGPSVAWAAPDEPEAAARTLSEAGFRFSAERDGPLGPERLIVDGATPGRYVLLVGRLAGTIRP